jgi:multidrug efflux system membrane fusion protein
MHRLVIALALSGSILLAGCQRRRAEPAPPAPPVVPISHPVSRQVTDYVDYPSQTETINSVDITPRASGYLVKVPFKEGTEVKKNDLLFEVDPRPYKAAFQQAQAQVRLQQANLRLAESELVRARRAGTAVTPEDVEKSRATVATSSASLESAKATLETARLNLGFTKVTSPIDGRVSRIRRTIGNLVIQDQTVLTTVVSLDPIYAYFNMDARTLLKIRTAINQGKIKVPSDRSDIPVYLGLEGEEGFPHQGNLNFVNNQINPGTSTISVRARFDNPQPSGGVRLLSPGMFVRIRLPIGQPHQALLVIDRALGSDQGRKFVYVVDENDTIQYRGVETGPLQPDGLRVIVSGVKADDWVVGALPQIRPNMKVQTDRIAMPNLAGPPAPGQRPQPPPPGHDQGKDKRDKGRR